MKSDRIASMKKIELHCHLDGSMRADTISELVNRHVDIEELSVGMECGSLAEYLEKFELPIACLQTAEGLKRAAREFILDSAEDGVIYTEVRFAPLLHTSKGLKAFEVMEAVIEGLKEGRELTGTEFGAIACAMRHQSIESSRTMLRELKDFTGEGLAACDLAGDEAAYPMENFMEFFSYAGELGYKYTIHAGECGRAENIRLAIEAGAGRIGHGIAMAGNPGIMKLCRDKRIGIEICPISNMHTKAVDRIENYPVREFLDNKLLVTVNTDNRTVSSTSLEKEYGFLKERAGITEDELLLMRDNAIEASFASDDVKNRLINICREVRNEQRI